MLGTTAAPGTRGQADAVAAAVGGVVSGGIEDVGIYQLRWATLQDTDVHAAALREMAGVAGVEPSFVLNWRTLAAPRAPL